MELTFTSNQYLLQSDLLVYGMFRWASRGLFLGEQRHYLNIDVDDWFNTADERLPDGTINSDPGWSMSAHDAYNAYLQQTALRTQYPLASTLTLRNGLQRRRRGPDRGQDVQPERRPLPS